jgi:DNA helicase-2/ATP-dependent DNA helicase PcrA
MDDRMAAEAVTAARELLRSFKEAHPDWGNDKTPVDAVVDWYGLEVTTFFPGDQPQGTYGWLEPGEDLIWLCRDLAETLRRFTLAHELGHAVLHRSRGEQQQVPEPSPDDPCQSNDVQEAVTGPIDQEQFEEILGIGQAYNPRSQRELAANIFAAELLMPLERVASLYLGQQVAPQALAGVFGVSTPAMLNRLVGLMMGDHKALHPGRDNGDLEINAGLAPPLMADKSAVGAINRPLRIPGVFCETPSSRSFEDGGQGDEVEDTHTGGTEESFPADGEEVSQHEGEGRQGDDRGPQREGSTSSRREYDEFQRAAIEAAAPALIVAGPGSGKTSTLIGRVEYLIRTLGVPAQHILALTFSRKAAQEMQERLHQALQGTPAHDTPPMVSTFHAFCAELLRTYGERVGLRSAFSLIDDAEGYFLLRGLARELPLRYYQHLRFPTFYFPDILRAISRAKDELVTPEQYRWLAQQMLEWAQDEEGVQAAEKALEVADIYACYQAGLQRRGDTDFGGLIMLTTQLLQEHAEVLREQQERYQHILVDEFQDMNRASGVLLRLLAGEECRVWVVGDVNQAIYSFRGASPANIANFQEDYPGATVLPLNRNYRSRPDIVNLADAFRERAMETGAEAGTRQVARPTQPGSYVTLAAAADEASELEGLVADMRCKQALPGYSYGDMVVLCRTRAQARKVSQALTRAGLPVIERGGGSLVEQEHMRDALSVVLLLADPGGMGILRAARRSEHAMTQEDVEALLLAAREQQCPPGSLIVRGEAPATMSSQGRRSLLRLADMLQALRYMTDTWSMLAQYLLVETSIVRDLLRMGDHDATGPQGEQSRQVLADYAGLLQLARQYDQRRRQEDEQEQGMASMPEQAKEFLDYLSVLASLRQDGGQRREGAEDEAGEGPTGIRVMTVHASKGLEFPIVYLPGLVQRRFPMQGRSSPIAAPVGMLPLEGAGQNPRDVAESGEACLFYVGVTRARDQLILSYSEHYGKQNYKASPYLDALMAGLPADRLVKVYWQGGTAAAVAEETGEQGSLAATEVEAIPGERGNIMPYQPSEGFITAMESRVLSAPAVETYQICPRRYAYGNIYRFQREENAYQLFWQATRKTLQALQASLAEVKPAWEERGEGESPAARLPAREEFQDLYAQHWQAIGGHESPFASIYEQHGREIIGSLWSVLAGTEQVAWELQRSFEVEVAGRTIRVEVDRVETPAQAGRPARFVRTRIGKSKGKPAAEVRELLYAHAYRQQYPGQSIKVFHHNLSTGEMLAISLTEKREQRLLTELAHTIRGLERHAYPATPDSFICPSCPFFLICPA